MQMIIHTGQDLKLLQGKFVLRLEKDNPDQKLSDMSWKFAKEKRLFLICGTSFVDLFGGQTQYEDFETFKSVFNHYLFKHMIDAGKTDGGRFHRLLTTAELSYLFDKLISENY